MPRLRHTPPAGSFRLSALAAALMAAAGPAAAQPTSVYGDLPCAVFVDLPAPASSGDPFLPFTVTLCDGGAVTVTSRCYPLRPAPYTDQPFYTGTFSWDLGATWRLDPIAPLVNPGDWNGRYQGRATVGWDLLLDFDQPLTSFGMSTCQSNGAPLTTADRLRLFDGPQGTGNLVAEVVSDGPPPVQYHQIVRFSGYDAGAPVIRSAVIDVQSNTDGVHLDGLAFGSAPATSSSGDVTPAVAVLHPAVPNPFNPRTTIRFELPRGGYVRLALHDLRGRLVRELLAGPRPAGAHEVILDGGELASGVYLVRLTGSGGTAPAQRITLLR
ncbi:MAG: T9SS type A sorting domain-containing protein [Krumholzibacteria bacterium]|nr:T9SS type A sorting domain-containing protein [Candidatus Krumholzibacteria bacterium]